MRLTVQTTIAFTVAALAAWAPSRICAAPDDTEVAHGDDLQTAANARFAVGEENFDQWVFQGARNAETGRQRLHTQLKLHLDEIDRVCTLTDVQKQKLELAARGDLKSFFDQVEVVRRKFLAVRNDQNAFGQIWQEIEPLQTKQSMGLFGDDSFFAKTVRKTLNAEQVAKYQAVVDERRRFRYQATIEVSLATLENSVPLRHQQREALQRLLIEGTRPPRVFGQYDYYVVMTQFSKLPEATVKQLLDARQWELLQQQFRQHGRMEAFLVQNGVLEKTAVERGRKGAE